MTTFIYFLGFIACLLVGGFSVTRRWDYTPYTALMQKTMDVKDLTEQYNAAIGDLEKKYKHDKIGTKRQYSKTYQSLARQYHSERRRIISTWEKMNPSWCKARQAWGWIFFIGLTVAFFCCSFSLPDEESSVSSIVNTTDEKYWNAETIPIPHLQDANQYVSNPGRMPISMCPIPTISYRRTRLTR